MKDKFQIVEPPRKSNRLAVVASAVAFGVLSSTPTGAFAFLSGIAGAYDAQRENTQRLNEEERQYLELQRLRREDELMRMQLEIRRLEYQRYMNDLRERERLGLPPPPAPSRSNNR